MKIINDVEIDNLKENDLLSTYPYVSLIKSIIEDKENTKSNNTLRIALYGDWGTGKSTILKTVEKEIRDKEKNLKSANKKTRFITFDAWKHSDSFRRSFLIEVSKKVKDSYSRNLFSFSKFGKGSIVLLIVILVILFFISKISFINNSITSFGFIIGVLTYILNKLWELNIKTLDYPERFEKIFNKITKEYYYNEFNNNNRIFKNNKFIEKKLVIIVDNIDRCDKKDALNILFDIKTILDSDKNIIFLIPIDKSYILEALESKKEKENYLKKLFDLEIYIKEYTNQGIYEFTVKLIKRYLKDENLGNEVELKEEQIPNIAFFISQKYSKDPRKIIKFLNLLKIEVYLYSVKENQGYMPKGKVTNHIDFLAKVLIIREQWPEDYRELVLRPYHLLGTYKSINSDIIEETKIEGKGKENETRIETQKNKNNDDEINELINLKKEIHQVIEPHYFLGWDDGNLSYLTKLIDQKLSFKEIQKEYEGDLIE